MKIILFILVVFAIAVTVIKGYSDDELWKAFKVSQFSQHQNWIKLLTNLKMTAKAQAELQHQS
jgi:hypothetical protein